MAEYNYKDADMLHAYVRRNKYRDNLSNTALHIYFEAMPELEKLKTGLCQQTTATYAEIAEYAAISIPTIGLALDALNGVLCAVKKGEPVKVKGGGVATVFRRFTIAELKDEKVAKKIKPQQSKLGEELKRVLNRRSIAYGNSVITPYWGLGKTGRLHSSSQDGKVNVQLESPEKRMGTIGATLPKGMTLYNIDYKQAEPSVIWHAMANGRYGLYTSDMYDRLASRLGISRDEAKKKLSALHYSSQSPVETVKRWPEATHEEFMLYAKALEEFREKLWQQGMCEKKGARRSVKTLYGSIIKPDRGEKDIHRGKILCWYARGTVADIMHRVCLEIISQEEAKRWKFMFQVHDSAYVISYPGYEDALVSIFKEIPARQGLYMDLDVKRVGETPLKNAVQLSKPVPTLNFSAWYYAQKKLKDKSAIDTPTPLPDLPTKEEAIEEMNNMYNETLREIAQDNE